MSTIIHLFQKYTFAIRFKVFYKIIGLMRRWYYTILGMKVHNTTSVPNIFVTWPHQVKIGKNCILEHNIYFKYDGIWSKGPSISINNNVFIGSGCEFNIRQEIVVGDNTLIASGCRFIDHDHGINASQIIRIQNQVEISIKIGSDVWIGCNSVILKGVEIGDGAIIGAGAVVNKSVQPGEIWVGIPARRINRRVI